MTCDILIIKLIKSYVITLRSNLWLHAMAAWFKAFTTEAYESSSFVYLPTRQMVTSRNSRSDLKSTIEVIQNSEEKNSGLISKEKMI